MLDTSDPTRNTTAPETPSPGQTFYELLEHRPSAWPHIHEGARLQVAIHAWILLSAHDFAAPDDSHVMDVLARAWQDPACRSWMQNQQELWARDRRADFANRLEALAAAVEGLPRLVSVSGLDTTPPAWLWYPLIPRGALTLVIGQPATGKTTLLAWLAARLSHGDTLPNFSGHPRPVVRQGPEFVAWYDSESTGGAFRRRLEAAGADLDMVRYASPDTATTLDAVDAIKADLNAMPTLPALVVFDTLGGFLTGKTALESMSDMRRLLRPLAALADETGTAVVLLHHEGKARRADLMHAGVGSIGIMGAARSALFCGKHPDSEGVYVMLHAKASEEATAQPVAYRLERHELGNGASTVKVKLDGVSNVDPLNVMNRPLPDDGDRGALTEAIEWLSEELAEGPVPVADLKIAAKRDGFSWRTLERAAAQLGMAKRRSGDETIPYRKRPWTWALIVRQEGVKESLADYGGLLEDRIKPSDELVRHSPPNDTNGVVGGLLISVPDTQPESGDQEAKTSTFETCTHDRKRQAEDSGWRCWECVDCGAKKMSVNASWRPANDPCPHVDKESLKGFDDAFQCLDCGAINLGILASWHTPNLETKASAKERLLQAVQRYDASIG